MNITFHDLDLSFEIQKQVPNVIAIESPTYFSLVVGSINSSVLGENQSCCVNDELDSIDLSKNAFLCCSPFYIDLNDKRFLAYAIKQIQVIASNEPAIQVELSESISLLQSSIFKLIEKSDFDLDFSKPLSLSSILKVLGLTFQQEDISLLSKTIEYIKLISKVVPNTPVLFFVNLYSYFEENEISELFKLSQAMEITFVDFEGNFKGKSSICNATLTTLDNDLCII